MAASVVGARSVPNWSKLKASDATASGDPNSLLSGSVTDGSGGFAMSVLGGIATPEPQDGAWWTFPAFDTYGRQIVGSSAASWLDDKWMFREGTPPSLSSDIVISVGLSDRSDMNNASCSYRGAAMTYQAGFRGVRGFGRNNSLAMQAWDDPTPTGLARRVLGSHNHGQASGADQQVRIGGYTDAMGECAGEAVTAWITQTLTNDLDLYWFVSVGRLASTAGTEAIDFSAFGMCTPRAQTFVPE